MPSIKFIDKFETVFINPMVYTDCMIQPGGQSHQTTHNGSATRYSVNATEPTWGQHLHQPIGLHSDRTDHPAFGL